ncbi:IclR family transcriptional regulator [Stappia indica]|uniref:Transcriptional regulator, IclR family n=1 Tax=Stappia indica TaxID=538381 RepID=A0A285SF29_9HYPH|nr:IclR family transcriptional regulator [Stappia indica]SOC06532.1 transcriptional regulator, IclR family [Stappia indica]
MPREKQDTLFVGSLDKGLRVLSLFNEHHTVLGLTEIAELAGLDKSAAQRLTNTLHKTGYLNKDPESRRYSPSIKFLELGNAYQWADPLVQLAMPKAIELGRSLGERVNVARLAGQEIVYVIRIPTQLTAFGAMVAGRRLSALTTSSGRAMIARLSEEERKVAVATWPIKPLTPKTTTDRAKIGEAIEEAVAYGYGLTHSENIMNEIGIAAPIMSGDGRPVATVQCSVSSLKWSVERVRGELAPHLIEVANSIHLPRGA